MRAEWNEKSRHDDPQSVDNAAQPYAPPISANEAVVAKRTQTPYGRKFLWLSLAIYLFGFLWATKISLTENGMQAIGNFIATVFLCWTSSFLLAIIAIFTDSRAWIMLFVQIATIAVLFFLH